MIRRNLTSSFPIVAFICLATACTTRSATSSGTPPELSAIDTAQLRSDLYTMASDAMRGREAGTLDELTASAWVAERARDAGLQPAGDNGTYFQFWPMRRIRTTAGSTASLDGKALALWKEGAVMSPVEATLNLPIVWVGNATDEAVSRMNLHGKAAAAMVVPPSKPPVASLSLRAWRYTRQAITQRAAALVKAGAAAVVLVADDSTDGEFLPIAVPAQRGTYAVDTAGAEKPRERPPVLWVRKALQSRVAGAHRLSLSLHAESFDYPSVNIVAKVPGSDAKLRDEYVLFSGHTDHDGVRYPVNGDSIWNGADDNASVAVAMLAIGRAFVAQPGRRSALFVWHGAEERGLLGSRYFAVHPTVPESSIVAVLNGDMIGRNSPDSAAILGIQPPRRNSAALAQMALDANATVTKFALDTTWDRPTEPEHWYFRSDHVPYAAQGIPVLFFTTLLHPDYHTPADEAPLIDYPKLAKMASLIYTTGWYAANADVRPAVDSGFTLRQ